MLRLERSSDSCNSEIRRKETTNISDSELFKASASTSCLSKYKRSFQMYLNNMAGFKKITATKK